MLWNAEPWIVAWEREIVGDEACLARIIGVIVEGGESNLIDSGWVLTNAAWFVGDSAGIVEEGSGRRSRKLSEGSATPCTNVA